MRLRYLMCSDLFGGIGKSFEMALLALLLTGLSATQGLAGDVSPQAADSLNVSTSTTNLLPQSQAAEAGWLNGFHVSGYASQTFGMWQNPTALRDLTPSRNNLATSRTLLQVDENYRLNEEHTFFMREWFVYEPPYSFNSANNFQYTNNAPINANPFLVKTPGAAIPAQSFGHYMNGYYNNYQVRDAWWENKTGPLTTFVGNQIVVWGQSLAFRVGDVVNPGDTCWNFGFANLEQSRNAQWMLHPVLNLPEFGPTNSNFLELIVIPGFSPNWWPEQKFDPEGKYRDDITAGRVQPCFPAANHGASARFDIHYSRQFRFGINGGGGPGPGVSGFSNPVGHLSWVCPQLNAGLGALNPVPVGFRRASCNLGLSKREGQATSFQINDGSLVDTGYWHVPGMQPENWNEGVRFHTLLGATELTAIYYNDNVSGGAPWSARWTPGTNLWNYSFYEIQNAGVTADRPLPIPASIAEYFPAVGRAEMIYSNHNSFSDMTWYNFNGSSYSDVVKWMAAIDLDQAYAPWLTSTGNLSANLEVEDNIIMDKRKLFTIGNAVDSVIPKNDVSVLFNIGTSWFWEDFEPTWTMIYNPKGTNFALFPALTLNPPWTKKYFLKLQAIEVLGGDKLQNVGLFKGESLLTAQFQYNFNLL